MVVAHIFFGKVLCIGGAPMAGKTMVARILWSQRSAQVFEHGADIFLNLIISDLFGDALTDRHVDFICKGLIQQHYQSAFMVRQAPDDHLKAVQ